MVLKNLKKVFEIFVTNFAAATARRCDAAKLLHPKIITKKLKKNCNHHYATPSAMPRPLHVPVHAPLVCSCIIK
jgi:hypothetical protein